MKPNFGQAFTITEIRQENHEAEMQRWTDEVMRRMTVLLPEEYGGVYRDHPKVKSWKRLGRIRCDPSKTGTIHPRAGGALE
jgi:hypothetical protein